TPDPIGLHYQLDYRVVYANAAYQTAFFSALTGMARPEVEVDGHVRNGYQDLYNAQPNALDVDANWVIDGASVERWLLEHPATGPDPRPDPVYLVSWWGRPSFRFHTYRAEDGPDPDTGHDVGFDDYQHMTGWGGTPGSRTRFFDLSAGPTFRGGSYDLQTE